MIAVARKAGDKSGGKRTRGRPRARKGLSFGFFLFVCVMLAGTGVFILVQHQFAVMSELKVDKVERRIAGEKARQKSLRIELARLKSPARTSRIAMDELGMVEPGGVIYLKYGRDAKGNMVCQSSYEKRSVSPIAKDTAEKKEAGDKKETGEKPPKVTKQSPTGVSKQR